MISLQLIGDDDDVHPTFTDIADNIKSPSFISDRNAMPYLDSWLLLVSWSTWDPKQDTIPGNNQPKLAVSLSFSLSPYFIQFKVDFQLTKSRETETISPNAFLYYTFSGACRVVFAQFFLDAFINQKISNSLSGNPFGFRAIPSLSLLVNLNSGHVLLV